MGYKRKILKLVFADTPELEIYVRSVNVGRALQLMQMADQLAGGQVTDMKQAEKVTNELFGAFADRVQSWTLEEDDGTPVPPVLACCRQSGRDVPGLGHHCGEHPEIEGGCPITGLLDWDFDDALLWVLAWLQKATSVSVPTAAPTGTGNPLEASIPMASASGM